MMGLVPPKVTNLSDVVMVQQAQEAIQQTSPRTKEISINIS